MKFSSLEEVKNVRVNCVQTDMAKIQIHRAFFQYLINGVQIIVSEWDNKGKCIVSQFYDETLAEAIRKDIKEMDIDGNKLLRIYNKVGVEVLNAKGEKVTTDPITWIFNEEESSDS